MISVVAFEIYEMVKQMYINIYIYIHQRIKWKHITKQQRKHSVIQVFWWWIRQNNRCIQKFQLIFRAVLEFRSKFLGLLYIYRAWVFCSSPSRPFEQFWKKELYKKFMKKRTTKYINHTLRAHVSNRESCSSLFVLH